MAERRKREREKEQPHKREGEKGEKKTRGQSLRAQRKTTKGKKGEAHNSVWAGTFCETKRRDGGSESRDSHTIPKITGRTMCTVSLLQVMGHETLDSGGGTCAKATAESVFLRALLTSQNRLFSFEPFTHIFLCGRVLFLSLSLSCCAATPAQRDKRPARTTEAGRMDTTRGETGRARGCARLQLLL